MLQSIPETWQIYHDGCAWPKEASEREVATARDSYFGGALSVLKILEHILEKDGPDAAIETIRASAAQLRAMQQPHRH